MVPTIPNIHEKINKLPIQIWVAATFIGLYSDERGNVGPGVNIGPYIKSKLMEREWTQTVDENGVPLKGSHHWVVTANYSHLDKDGFARLPRYCLDSLLSFIGAERVKLIPMEPYPAKYADIRMKNRFELRENQYKPVEFLCDTSRNFKPLNISTGSGKALRNGSLVLTESGWKPIEELHIGDRVYTPYGYLSTVTGVFPQGKQSMFRITFNDRRWIDVTGDHLWEIRYYLPRKYPRPKREIHDVVTTLDMLGAQGTRYSCQCAIPLIGKIDCDDKQLPLDPYVLGALLGDGHMTTNQVQIATDMEIVDEILHRISFMGLEKSIMRPDKATCSYVRFIHPRSKKSFQYERNPLVRVLDEMGILRKTGKDKFIPDVYLHGSYQQRLDLIRGLLDTDGSTNSHGIEFCSISKNLADGVQYLARSLGYCAYMFERTGKSRYKGILHDVQHQYLVLISKGDLKLLITLTRKKNCIMDRKRTTKPRLFVRHISPLPEKQYATCISIDDPLGLYITNDFIVTHNTVMTIYALSQLKVVSLIVLPGLIDQWYRSFREFTQLRKEDIYVIQGIKSLELLWKMVEQGYQPAVILAAMRTLNTYAVEPKGTYLEMPDFQQFQRRLGLGCYAGDESHVWMFASVRLQLMCDIRYNIFLSATFARSQFASNTIFQMIFPPELRYAPDEIKKYTVVHFIEYSLGIPLDQTGRFVSTIHGYNHARYENFLLKHKIYLNEFTNRVILPLINMYYISQKKEGQKLLILNWTKKMCKHIETVLNQNIKDLKVKSYFSGSTPESNLNADIIVSTHKSCSTGRDVRGLKTCINTVSFSSIVLAQQVMGRLREIPGDDTIFVDLWNKDVGTHYRHSRDRLRIYRQLAKLVFENRIT